MDDEAPITCQPPKPPLIQVFGILHLVFASMGIFGALGSIGALVFTKKVAELSAFGASEEHRYQIVKAYVEMQDELFPASLATLIMTAITVVLLILAGIQLLKTKRTSLKLSNRYAWFSIFTKIVGMLLFVGFISPITKAYNEQIFALKGISSMSVEMEIGASVGGIVGYVVAMIYPILSLVLLNRESVRNYLQAHGK